ncbi:MAG: UDP-N-acetylglucosamine--N-acetylmuramyl-(pentapeptide) pyrophosphoryl-undecaprenol N-acetylglucosamine transferase [Firmicutes bacterium ADurb.Bin456]|nr:MAG: UDP-N-acetylglucosamine--N-acetylmuramyl-(pentapeptide) pyrophosphoryl-undecaprenol N-acetylglucosamine transferase [Firmicutes bacterium ADurb.Bin456]
MRFIVSGGGTGGHIYPALAIARGLQNRYPGAEILYVGTSGGMEGDIVPRAGLPFRGIPAAGLRRKLSLHNLLVFWRAGHGFLQASGVIRKYRPSVVIGTGGYVCGPVVLAAALKGIPTLIHEQNALPGITNRILARFSSKVAVTFADSAIFFPHKEKTVLTGLPVRPEVLSADREEGLKKLDYQVNRFLLLAFGGSRGARSVNQAMLGVLKKYAGDPRLNVLLVTGKDGYEDFLRDCSKESIDLAKTGNIKVSPYLYNMQDALAAADLVISRAGAATLAELTALGIPSILIPYPYASENHQEFNARALEKEGAAQVVLDRDLNGELLCHKVETLLKKPDLLSQMAEASKRMGKQRALQDIIDCVDKLIKR